LFGKGNPIPFFLAPRRFESAERTGNSFSMTLSGTQCYGVGIGPEPPINPLWTRCSIDHCALGNRLGPLVADDRWDLFSIETAGAPGGAPAHLVRDDTAVTAFLRRHAPDSSVWPGNREIVAWYALDGEAGQWASLGALVRWESGRHVLASVATSTELRGRGFAQALVRGIVGEAQQLAIPRLGLGVSHANIPAQRVYGNVGFALCANFTNYVEAQVLS
jgi:ribosomal protein S18 acetylase RimI-like enzyme